MEAVSRYRWVILGLAFLGQTSNSLSVQAIAPLAPLFQPELGLSKTEVGLFASAAYLGAWTVLLVGGSLTDRFGVRVMMSFGQLLAGSFLLLMALVRSFPEAVMVMLMVGLGRGTVVPGATKSVLDWFTPRARATAMGLKQTGYPVGGIATASLLPVLALSLGWRSAIALVGILILAGGVITAAFYREANPSGRSVARQAGIWTAIGVVIRNRGLWAMSIMSTMFVTVQLATVNFLALYFKEVVLVDAVPEASSRVVAAGAFLALFQLGGGFARVSWGVFSDRVMGGRRMVVMAIIGALSAFLAVLISRLGPGYPLWLLGVLVVACGTTIMGWNGLYQALIVETAGRKYAATGVGLSMTLSQVGTTGGPPMFGFIVDLSGSYQIAWLSLAGISTLGALMAAVMARGEKHVA